MYVRLTGGLGLLLNKVALGGCQRRFNDRQFFQVTVSFSASTSLSSTA
jgi:hypothetical protein